MSLAWDYWWNATPGTVVVLLRVVFPNLKIGQGSREGGEVGERGKRSKRQNK